MTFPLNFVSSPAQAHDIADRVFDEFTMAGWINFTGSASNTSYLAAMAMMRNQAQNSPVEGAIGVRNDVGYKGRPYFQPGYSVTVARCPTSLVNQGWTHIAIRLMRASPTQAIVAYYINGAPVHEAVIAYPVATTSALQVGGYHKIIASLANGLYTIKPPDEWQHAYFNDVCISEDDLAAFYLTQRQALGVEAPKVAVCYFGDSRTAFSASPVFASIGEVSGVHQMLDAWGGSFYAATASNYAAPVRRGLRQRFIKYAAAHYQKVVIWAAHGVNDIAGNGRAMSPNSPYGSWQDGATVIDMMLQEDKEAAGCQNQHKVKLLIDTIWPHGVWLQTDPARNAIREDYNEWRRYGWASHGYDYQIDTAAWTPDGFNSFEDCASHAYLNGGNAIIVADGIHWTTAGGFSASQAIMKPKLEEIVDSL